MTGPFTAIEDIGELRGALFGLDLGTRTIGVAVSDEGWRVAAPLVTIRRTKFRADADALLAHALRYNVVALVVGMPLNMDGSVGPRAQSTRDFARNLARVTDRPLVAWDERWSTVAAERELIATDTSRARRREAIDRHAAAVILQGALDRLRALGLPRR
ncbi:Holliday junction resolvase RuvX [Acuticoccus sp.]|uniref:Holliday junction resolvase RuvX n=1 Tax=Acuticoccus sp. TaxID=1904378 RepID=UPI003B51EA2D